MKVTLQHVVNVTEPQDLNNIMQAELSIMEQRHKIGQKMYSAMGMYAPAFGMIGTLVGLIQMLQNLTDPSSVGPGMAMAMITTFYGALFANLFFLPMSGKLKQRSDQEMQFKGMLLTGVLAVQAEESPRVIHNKLLCYLKPGDFCRHDDAADVFFYSDHVIFNYGSRKVQAGNGVLAGRVGCPGQPG